MRALFKSHILILDAHERSARWIGTRMRLESHEFHEIMKNCFIPQVWHSSARQKFTRSRIDF
jgi:hypothetical protein